MENSPEADVIIIDNGSTDDSIDFLQTNFPEVQIIKLDDNYGFCGGYNRGLEKLNHKYFLLLNSDIEVSQNWLPPLLETIQEEKVAIVQPKILDYNNKSKFEYAGAAGGFIDKYGFPFCRGRIFTSLEKDNGQHNTEEEIVWATGASMLIKSNVWRELGGLDELFFAHMEEIDLCWRAGNSGYIVKINPKSVIYHVGGGTLSKSNPRKTFLNFRNGLFLLYKNTPKEKLLSTIFIRLILDGVAAVYFLINGLPKDFWAVARAHFAFYRMKGKLKRSRNAKIPEKTLSKSIVWEHFVSGKRLFKDL